MRLATAFDLRPDELLYSAIARYGAAMAYPRQRSVLAAAFGRPAGVAVVAFPGRLAALPAQLPPGHDVSGDDLLWRHTLLPYHAWCVPGERVHRVARTLLEGDARGVHERLGVRASAVPSPSHLRYCATCVDVDRATYSGSYWRRVQQLPGVYICPTHFEPLRASGVRRVDVEARLTYRALDGARGRGDRAALADAAALMRRPNARTALAAIARDSVWLLAHVRPSPGLPPHQAATCAPGRSGPPSFGPGLEQLWACCRERLTDAAFVRPSGRLLLKDLRAAFVARYGRPLLEALGCPLRTSAGGDDWLARLARRPRVAQHPLHHLLLLHLLDFRVADAFRAAPGVLQAAPRDVELGDRHSSRDRGSTPCLPDANVRHAPTGAAPSPDWDSRLRALVRDHLVSLREVARRLGVDPRTVQRHARRLRVWRTGWRPWARCAVSHVRRDAAVRTRRAHRAAWRAARRADPLASVAALRGARPATYSYLYRYDRAWLDAHRPAPARARSRRSRVDWPQRDAVLCQRAARVVAGLRGLKVRPVRITVTAVARRLAAGTLLSERRDRLPVTTAYVSGQAESRLEYAARRVRWTAGQFAADATVPPRWAFVRAAGLRPALADALAPLIACALTALRRTVAEGGARGAAWRRRAVARALDR